MLKSGTLNALAAPIFFTILNATGAWSEGVYFWVWFPLMVPVMVALPSMLGVRRRQGVSYLDAFAATRPLATGHLVGLKVLVNSLSIFLSWAVLVAVLWLFAVRLAVWGPEAQAESINIGAIGSLRCRARRWPCFRRSTSSRLLRPSLPPARFTPSWF